MGDRVKIPELEAPENFYTPAWFDRWDAEFESREVARRSGASRQELRMSCVELVDSFRVLASDIGIVIEVDTGRYGDQTMVLFGVAAVLVKSNRLRQVK